METISHYFQQVLFVIGDLKGKMIKPPSKNTPPKIKDTYTWFPYFKVSTLHDRSILNTRPTITNMNPFSFLHIIVLGLSMALM
jgi:hypothetical protein